MVKHIIIETILASIIVACSLTIVILLTKWGIEWLKGRNKDVDL